jgi:hypothetical protein
MHSNARTSPNIRWSGFAVLTIVFSHFGQLDLAMMRPPWRIEAFCSATTLWRISLDPQPVRCRRARNWNTRRSANQARCDQVRSASASCGPDSSGSVAARSELAMVRAERKFQACDAPSDRCSTLTGTDSSRKPRLRWSKHAAPRCHRLINIAHIPKELTADQANVFDPYLVHPERGIAALDSIVGRNLSRP